MAVLGITGGPHGPGDDPRQFPYIDGYWHDAAAVIIEAGEVLCGYEEERLTRLKHTTSFPTRAIEACLSYAGLGLNDLEAVAIYFTEDYWEQFLTERLLYDSHTKLGGARSVIASRLRETCGAQIDTDRLCFIRHHHAHAVAAWRGSGFDESLVVTLDGAGETESGMVASARENRLEELWTLPINHSLGGLYLWVTRFLGYGQFDEYKVMGLAALGKAGVLGNTLGMIRLFPNGRYEVDWGFAIRLRQIAKPRRCDEPITEFHADLAAAVQDAIEEAVLHLLRSARKRTGHSRLCLAGGVAHNCSMNGKIASSEQFHDVFVHPASHDAGCALGAALAVELTRGGVHFQRRVQSVFWGTSISDHEIAVAAERWRDCVAISRKHSVIDWAAQRLADGAILGWVQGRAEFGPRALGHRSLLADPRPAANRARINDLIKQRESFRPLAPIVQAEYASTFFCIPAGVDCSFMSFAIPVNPQWRPRLAAVTHVDGTARIQTISRVQDSLLWALLERFGELSGVPMLLNTSFNVAGEPIVDSVDDVITCLLTTNIEAAVVGHVVIQRAVSCDVSKLALSVRSDVRLSQRPGGVYGERLWILEQGGPQRRWSTISDPAVDILRRADGSVPVAELIAAAASGVASEDLSAEVLELWRRRLVNLLPPNQPM